MTYSEIEDLLFCDETSELVLDGDYYTDPFFAIVNHRVGDMFLFYTLDGDYAVIYGFVIIDPISKSVIRNMNGLNKVIRLSNIGAKAEQYKHLYEQIHEFAFMNSLSISQLEILKEFYNLLHLPEYTFFFEIYNSIIPEFLTWIKHQLSI